MGLIRFNDRNGMSTFSSVMDDFFNRSFADLGGVVADNRLPAVNVKETDEAFGLEVALPGVAKDQVNVALEKDQLTISSEVESEKEESKGGYTRREFGHKSFRRVFNLPEIADQEKVGATFENGVLHINIPKRSEQELKNTRTISVG